MQSTNFFIGCKSILIRRCCNIFGILSENYPNIFEHIMKHFLFHQLSQDERLDRIFKSRTYVSLEKLKTFWTINKKIFIAFLTKLLYAHFGRKYDDGGEFEKFSSFTVLVNKVVIWMLWVSIWSVRCSILSVSFNFNINNANNLNWYTSASSIIDKTKIKSYFVQRWYT